MSHTIKWEANGVLVNYQDIVDIKDIVQSNYSMFNDIRLDKINYKIIDYSKVRSVNLDKQDIIVAATLNNVSATWDNTVKFAIITKNEYLLDINKIFMKNMDKSKWEGKIFSTIAEAKDWAISK